MFLEVKFSVYLNRRVFVMSFANGHLQFTYLSSVANLMQSSPFKGNNYTTKGSDSDMDIFA